jgi:hypothetical protein
MIPQPGKAQQPDEVYRLLLGAAARRQPVAAIYDNLPRWFCPHLLGRKAGRRHALVYQYGGSSHQGLPTMQESGGVWRCFVVEKLRQVELRDDAWRGEPRGERQTCVDEVDFDADAEPEEPPQ